MTSEFEILRSLPGMSCIERKTLPASFFDDCIVRITQPGELLLDHDERLAIRKAAGVVRRIAPDAEVSFCRGLEMNGDDVAGIHMPPDDAYRPSIMINAAYSPAMIVSSAYHEAFHRCQLLMSAAETKIMDAWAESMADHAEPPNLTVEGWWSLPKERLAWSFENFIHVRRKQPDPAFAAFMGFTLEGSDFPDDVVEVFERTLSGKIGRRAVKARALRDAQNAKKVTINTILPAGLIALWRVLVGQKRISRALKAA